MNYQSPLSFSVITHLRLLGGVSVIVLGISTVLNGRYLGMPIEWGSSKKEVLGFLTEPKIVESSW